MPNTILIWWASRYGSNIICLNIWWPIMSHMWFMKWRPLKFPIRVFDTWVFASHDHRVTWLFSIGTHICTVSIHALFTRNETSNYATHLWVDAFARCCIFLVMTMTSNATHSKIGLIVLWTYPKPHANCGFGSWAQQQHGSPAPSYWPCHFMRWTIISSIRARIVSAARHQPRACRVDTRAINLVNSGPVGFSLYDSK